MRCTEDERYYTTESTITWPLGLLIQQPPRFSLSLLSHGTGPLINQTTPDYPRLPPNYTALPSTALFEDSQESKGSNRGVVVRDGLQKPQWRGWCLGQGVPGLAFVHAELGRSGARLFAPQGAFWIQQGHLALADYTQGSVMARYNGTTSAASVSHSWKAGVFCCLVHMALQRPL